MYAVLTMCVATKTKSSVLQQNLCAVLIMCVADRNEALVVSELNSIMRVRTLVLLSWDDNSYMLDVCIILICCAHDFCETSNPVLGETKTADSVEIVGKSK